MALTPDEEKRFRAEIRERMKAREESISEERSQQDDERKSMDEDRQRTRIREEEEEQYFTERGYVKYTNRYGEVEWLRPEEARKRKRRRSSKKSPSRRRHRALGKVLQWAINIGMVVVALAAFIYFLKYNPIQQENKGSLRVLTDVHGAQIYINGKEKMGKLTPDTLSDLKSGSHFISVYKNGYAAWPPMIRASVEAGKTVTIEFALKNSGALGQLSVDTNIDNPNIYVDGILVSPQGSDLIQVPAGYHVVTAVKSGYLTTPRHRRILVEENGITRIQFEFEKNPEIGYLDISSNSNSAFAYLNNQLSGVKANGELLPVAAGVYEVRLCQNGYRSMPEVELVRIDPGETRALSFHLNPSTDMDTLQVVTSTPGAGIMVDGRWMPYVTSIFDLQVTEGIHFINVMRNGQLYADADIEVDANNIGDKRVQFDF